MTPKTLLQALALLPLLAGEGPAQGLHNDTRSFVAPLRISQADWTDPAELARTWERALVRLPAGAAGPEAPSTAELADWRPEGGAPLPVVLYLHGCSGIWEGTRRRIELMAGMGFLIVAPASLARQKYAQSCDPATHRGSLYRDVLKMRQADAAHAVRQVRRLPFVDPDRVILMGLSEGAITTATYEATGPEEAVNARVIEGWTCNAGWPEYKGLKAGAAEPVLSLVGKDDPWFQNDWTRGDCGPAMQPGSASRSVVFSKGPLAARHELLEAPEAQATLRAFLAERGLMP